MSVVLYVVIWFLLLAACLGWLVLIDRDHQRRAWIEADRKAREARKRTPEDDVREAQGEQVHEQ